MDWLKKLFGKSKTGKAAPAPKLVSPKVLPSASDTESIPEADPAKFVLTRSVDDPLYEATFEARDNYWKNIGEIDEDVIAHVISPQFMGAPHWPTTRQAYKIIRTETSLIIASDGLSDPFTDAAEHEVNFSGFSSEVFIESSELVGATFDDIKKSWQFEAVEIWSRNVANYGGINANLEKYPVMSIELPIHSLPEDWKNENGNVGFLVNCKMSNREYEFSNSPLSSIKLISLTAIKPDELKFVIEGGQKGRDTLAEVLTKKGLTDMNHSERQTVLE